MEMKIVQLNKEEAERLEQLIREKGNRHGKIMSELSSKLHALEVGEHLMVVRPTNSGTKMTVSQHVSQLSRRWKRKFRTMTLKTEDGNTTTLIMRTPDEV